MGDTEALKSTDLVFKIKESVTIIVRPFSDIISCDPHSNPARSGTVED